ncbi:MAG TPA: hypothetical protein VFE62_02140 [Gemmataceae bacterium]|nr:hypothetical protein [Gemmataceae bacterium]
MSHCVRLAAHSAFVAAFGLLSFLLVADVGAQPKQLKELQWSHAFDLACRRFGEPDITKDTRRWGVEAFRDNNTGLGLYISQEGSIAAAPNFATLDAPLKNSKGPSWLTGLDLPARKPGVKEFKKDTPVHAMEVFRDPNAENWLFITEKGNIAACNGKLFPGANNKQPKWLHSVDLAVRKGGVKEWKDATKVGIEVYRDGNSGNLVYITDSGVIAIIPESTEVKGEGKSPDWLHGLDLSCRRFDEKSFTKDTRKFGVEVYNDATTGNLIFVSETGSIGVAPAPKDLKAPTPKAKEPVWTHGLNVKCRKYGEKEFSDKTRSFGAEVFRDDNVDVILYINELGNIAVHSAK